MSIKLRDLIRAVRACKTAAEERAVISKECALIRTAIKEEVEQFRHRNVAKLMYIHMLGYPTHFGQMECLKLISAQSFPEKRIGYLALTLLLTENTEVLTLVTNSLKVDLGNSNQFIVALSLISIGNLATQDMARDLASDVEKILKSSNPYLRKKAALATIRLLKKEPDLIEHMSEKIVALLKDRSHGVLVTGLQLIIEILTLIPNQVDQYRHLVPSLVRLLRNFITMGYSPEHDVGGITDPFLQVRILKLLGILGHNNDEASDHMNDVLAQVATNTETAKNSGNAILYECVTTIMNVQSDSGLRVLAINILGRFLLNRDNNIRYVALNTLSKVIADDAQAVQRHRTTIVECLKDPDVSIRQRALELTYQLINGSNVEALTAELLNYLVVCPSDQKDALVYKIMDVIEKYSPSNKWKVDTVIMMLSVCGVKSDDTVIRAVIVMISHLSDFYNYATHRLFKVLQDDTSRMNILHVGIWCIGEYGDCLLRPLEEQSVSLPPVQSETIFQFLQKCLHFHNADDTTKSLVLNTVMKLSVRLPSHNKEMIMRILSTYDHSLNLELQQRCFEYKALLTNQWDHLRGDLLAKMPILDEAVLKKKKEQQFMTMGSEEDMLSMAGSGTRKATGGDLLGEAMGQMSVNSNTNKSAPVSANKPQEKNFLLDLDDIFGGGGSSTSVPISSASANVLDIFGSSSAAPISNTNSYNNSSGLGSSNDLLNDMFSSAPVKTTAPVATNVNMFGLSSPVNSNPAPMNNNLVNNLAMSAPLATNAGGVQFLKAFDKNGLIINLELSKPNPSSPELTKMMCKYSNTGQSSFTSFVFQAAVPKYLKIEMLPPSGTTIPGHSNNAVFQEMRLTNSMQGEKSIMVKFKIGYTVNGKNVEEMVQVSNFPPLY